MIRRQEEAGDLPIVLSSSGVVVGSVKKNKELIEREGT